MGAGEKKGVAWPRGGVGGLRHPDAWPSEANGATNNGSPTTCSALTRPLFPFAALCASFRVCLSSFFFYSLPLLIHLSLFCWTSLITTVQLRLVTYCSWLAAVSPSLFFNKHLLNCLSPKHRNKKQMLLRVTATLVPSGSSSSCTSLGEVCNFNHDA